MDKSVTELGKEISILSDDPKYRRYQWLYFALILNKGGRPSILNRIDQTITFVSEDWKNLYERYQHRDSPPPTKKPRSRAKDRGTTVTDKQTGDDETAMDDEDADDVNAFVDSLFGSMGDAE